METEKTYPNCGQHHSTGWTLRPNTKEEDCSAAFVSPAVCLWVHCDQSLGLPPAPLGNGGLRPAAVRWNEPFLPSVALDRDFVPTAGKVTGALLWLEPLWFSNGF